MLSLTVNENNHENKIDDGDASYVGDDDYKIPETGHSQVFKKSK